MSLRDGYRYERNRLAPIARMEDAKKAQLALKEKSKPVFKGGRNAPLLLIINSAALTGVLNLAGGARK